ncbi:MAG: methionine biosynthesis protein MetW [Chloroflexota bacterium]|nr:methionine biosynthesis protein MetW [Chloroflexota bacterium]
MRLTEPVRPDLLAIASLIPAHASVLDLGCGEGDLLLLLADRGVRGRGVELSEEGVRQCVKRGLSVLQGDVDEGLADYPDGSFDYVILSQTLPYLDEPRFVLKEMLRVGQRAVVSFANPGHWRCRMWTLLAGRTPEGLLVGQPWHASPRLHLPTPNDFRALCVDDGVEIVDALGLGESGQRVTVWKNLLAWTVIFEVTSSRHRGAEAEGESAAETAASRWQER